MGTIDSSECAVSYEPLRLHSTNTAQQLSSTARMSALEPHKDGAEHRSAMLLHPKLHDGTTRCMASFAHKMEWRGQGRGEQGSKEKERGDILELTVKHDMGPRKINSYLLASAIAERAMARL